MCMWMCLGNLVITFKIIFMSLAMLYIQIRQSVNINKYCLFPINQNDFKGIVWNVGKYDYLLFWRDLEEKNDTTLMFVHLIWNYISNKTGLPAPSVAVFVWIKQDKTC